MIALDRGLCGECANRGQGTGNREQGAGRTEKARASEPGPVILFPVPRSLFPLGGEAAECASHIALAQALERPIAKLTNTLARDTEHRTDLFERVLTASSE